MLGRLDIATLLLQAGADTRVEDEEEQTAEAIAHQYGHHMVADTINRYVNKSEFPPIIALAFFIALVCWGYPCSFSVDVRKIEILEIG